jgi:hypothetical protein
MGESLMEQCRVKEDGLWVNKKKKAHKSNRG